MWWKELGEEGVYSGSCGGDNPLPVSQIETRTTIVVQSDYKGKKIFREGEGMCIIHRNAMAQYLLSLDRKKSTVRQNAVVVSSMVSKKLPTLQIFYFCFSSWTAILSVLKANPEAFKWKPLINSFLTMLVPSLNIHHGNFVAGGPIILTKSSTSSGYMRWFYFLA